MFDYYRIASPVVLDCPPKYVKVRETRITKRIKQALWHVFISWERMESADILFLIEIKVYFLFWLGL